jgi:hypothetical protein
LFDAPNGFMLTILSQEEFLLEDEIKYLTERLNVFVQDVEDIVSSSPANTWTVLFKQVFTLDYYYCILKNSAGDY